MRTAIDDARILVAGVGNLFLGDDGFGPEVARRLAADAVPQGVRVTDYGVGGIHLTYDLLEGFDTLILLDVVQRGEAPGTVSVLEVRPDGAPSTALDAHSMDPVSVLAGVRQLGGEVPRTLVVACEPQDLAEGIGLSQAVASAVGPTVAAVRDLLERELEQLGAASRGRGPIDEEP